MDEYKKEGWIMILLKSLLTMFKTKRVLIVSFIPLNLYSNILTIVETIFFTPSSKSKVHRSAPHNLSSAPPVGEGYTAEYKKYP